MNAMASQITGFPIVYSTVCSGAVKKNVKAPRHWPLWGEFTGEFPAHRASNAENVPIWWRHHIKHVVSEIWADFIHRTRMNRVYYYQLIWILHGLLVCNSAEWTTTQPWWRRGMHMLCALYAWSWWRHPIETFPALLALGGGNSPVTGEFPSQRPVTRSFDDFFDLRLNRRFKFKFKFKMFFIASITRERKVTSMFKVRDRTKQTECIKMNCTQIHERQITLLKGYMNSYTCKWYIDTSTLVCTHKMQACMRTYAHACMYTHMNVWCMQAHSQAWTYKETLILQIYMLDKIYTCNIYG